MRIPTLLLLGAALAAPAALPADEAMAPEVTVSAEDCMAYLPQVAFNSLRDEYLAVWHDSCSAGPPYRRILARRLDRYGRPKGAVFQASPSGGSDYDRAQASLAYDRVNDRYLVVYVYDYWGNGSDWDVRGRYLAGDGTPSGDEFVVAATSLHEWNPEAAFSHVSRKFLVAWTREDPASPETVWGSLFAYGATPGSFPLSPGAAGNRVSPDLSYDPFADRFTAAFDTGSDVVAAMVDAAGALGAEFAIAAWPDVEIAPAVASCENWQHVVVWQSFHTPGKYEMYARFLFGSGSSDGGPLHLSGTTADERHGEVACLFGGIHYFVVYEQEYAGGAIGISGRRVSSTKAMREEVVIRTPAGYRPAVAGGRAGWLVVWAHERPASVYQDIRARAVWELFADGFEWANTANWSLVQL
jgi:hypothetical protein